MYFPKAGTSKLARDYLYKPSPSDHQLLRSSATLAKTDAPLPDSVDLRSMARTVRDQKQEGCCTGFASAAFREILASIKEGTIIEGDLSPAYLYANARKAEGTFPNDSGATIADELAGLIAKGVCPESYLPYYADPSEDPTPDCDTAAAAFRITAIQKVDFTDVTAIKAALAQKQPVVIAFEVFESFESPDGNGLVPMPGANEGTLGGHGVLVVGYNEQGWIVRNSWGTGWGLSGYVIMPYGYEQETWFEAYTASIQ